MLHLRTAFPIAAACLLAAASPAALVAQQDGAGPSRAVTVHALGLPFGVYSAEYQHVTGRRWSVGGAIVYYGEKWNDGMEEGFGSDSRQVIADLKLRAWNDDSPLHGFAMVLHLGTYSERTTRWWADDPTLRGELVWRTAPTVAVSFDVAHTQGGTEGLYLAGGAGFRTLLGGYKATSSNLMLTINGSIGLAW